MTIEERRYALRLSKLVSALTGMIAEKNKISEFDAMRRVYLSETYKLLSDERTKLWWYSVPALFDIFKTETETGDITNSAYVDGLV
jgi:hypothetical protein